MTVLSTPWKLATIVAGVLNLVIGGFLVTSYVENRAISNQRDALQRSITDPKTGYVARLTQAQNNVATLTEQIKQQNVAYRELSAQSAAKLADTKQRLAAAQRETARMQARIDAFMKQKIEGDTLEERVLDVDRRAVEEFLPDA